MKAASRVFVIIGMIASLILIIFGISINSYGGRGGYYIAYGVYSLFTSIFCLITISGSSKGMVILAGVLYIPVVLLASIFMFCIKEEDLY